jgi:hypothetical protein
MHLGLYSRTIHFLMALNEHHQTSVRLCWVLNLGNVCTPLTNYIFGISAIYSPPGSIHCLNIFIPSVISTEVEFVVKIFDFEIFLLSEFTAKKKEL